MQENEKYNLTAVRTVPAIVAKHLVDGLSLLPTLDAERPKSIVDIGSGAGFPGLVLAIARPRWQLTLVEAARKKTKFHAFVQDELKLDNVRSMWARAEDLARKEREAYDVAVARAVARMNALAEISLPLVRKGGAFLAQKSLDVGNTELAEARIAVSTMGGIVEDTGEAWTEMLLKEADLDERDTANSLRRCIVMVRKIRATPKTYPRSFAAISRKPL